MLRLIILFMLPLSAFAATCNNPQGETGTIIYNTTYSVVQVCNTAGNWIALGGNGNDGSSEVDPKVGAMQAGKWCTSSGTQVTCTSDAPTFTGGLVNLTDVNLTTPTNGDVLTYNGTNWVNSPVASSGGLGDRITSDTLSVIANPSGYVSLTTTGTTWGYLGGVNSYLPNLNIGTLLNIATTQSSGTLTVSGSTFTNILRLKETAGAAPSSFQGGHWQVSGSNVFYNNGNVGIGTSDPQSSLDVNGNASFRGYISLVTGGVIYGDRTSSSAILSLYSGANASSGSYFALYPSNQANYPGRISYVAVGDDIPGSYAHVFSERTTAGTANMLFSIRKSGLANFSNSLTVDGTISSGASMTVGTFLSIPSMVSGRADNAVCWQTSNGRLFQTNNAAGCTSESDIRLKKDIVTFTPSLEKLLALRPVTFHWKDEKKGTELQLGFIAQEANKVLPEITVAPDAEHKFWGMRYNALIPYLVKGLQEMKSLFDGQSVRITKLEDENKELRRRLEALENIAAHH